jgi:hypothetical protein
VTRRAVSFTRAVQAGTAVIVVDVRQDTYTMLLRE